MNGTKKDINVTEIKLDKNELTLTEGGEYTFTATIKPTDATNKSITWSSSDEKVATVKDGEITAIKEGTATITVKTNDGEYTDTCKVTVTKKVEEPKVDSTVSDKPIAQTGGSFIIAGAIITLVGLCIVLYKKNKSFNWK